MGKRASSVIDVILGEAVAGTPEERLADMKAIASAIVNRANRAQVSAQDVISAVDKKGRKQFDAYDAALPPGVEAYRSLAEQALQDVETNGPTHSGIYYATPSATANLPSGLAPVTSTTGHEYFDDPAGRSFLTAKGYQTPSAVAAAQGFLSPAAMASNAVDGLLGRLASNPVTDAISDAAKTVGGWFSPAAPGPGMAALAPNGLNFNHPDQTNIDPRMQDTLTGAFSELGINPDITSGYRSPSRNRSVGGAKQSLHMKGLAADIDMAGMTDAQRQDLTTALTQRGAGGLITYSPSPDMLHVDLRARDPAASPHFMFDRTAALMDNAPGWFQEMAKYGGIKTPDVGPVPPSRDPAAPAPDPFSAASLASIAPSMAASSLGLPSPFRPDNLAPAPRVPNVAPAPAAPTPIGAAQPASSLAPSPTPAKAISPSTLASVASMAVPGIGVALNAIPSALSPTPTTAIAPKAAVPPTIAPRFTPPARVASIASPQRTMAPASYPSFSAMDVWSGRTPAGVPGIASTGETVTRDQYGNTSITNGYGATTTTDPSGRSMAQLGSIGGIGSKIGAGLQKNAPGILGSMIGSAAFGPIGGILGGIAANQATGHPSGLGILSGLFGGGSKAGGGSSKSSRSGGARNSASGSNRRDAGGA